MKVPFLDVRKQNARFRDAFVGALSSVMHGPSLILGDEVTRFERVWAEYCRKQFCLGTGNAYDGLRILLKARGIGPGDEVIVASNTYIATWLAVANVGATIVPAEPDARTGLLDPARAREAVTNKTRAILATNLYGQKVDVLGLREALSASSHPNPILLLDAAQAHGLSGADLGDGAVFSFYPTKNLGCLGDGGAIVCDDFATYSAAKALRNYGSWVQNEHALVGENSRLDELQAAFLNIKLPLLNSANNRRAYLALQYFDGLLGANLSFYYPGPNSVYHQFVVKHRNRDDLRRRLANLGVGTLIHYPTPPHLQPAFKHLGYREGDFPIAEKLARSVLSLPIGPELTEEQVDYVIDSVRESA